MLKKISFLNFAFEALFLLMFRHSYYQSQSLSLHR